MFGIMSMSQPFKDCPHELPVLMLAGFHQRFASKRRAVVFVKSRDVPQAVTITYHAGMCLSPEMALLRFVDVRVCMWGPCVSNGDVVFRATARYDG